MSQNAPQSKHLPALDEVRGLAVLLVFASHAANDGLLPGWLGQGAGQLGVQLFFVLSGYLMFRLYGAEPFSAPAAWRFCAARAARILPIYWLVMGVSAAAAWAGYAPYYNVAAPDALIPAATLLIAPQELWSIPVEGQFYALFLLIWPLSARLRLGLSHCAVLLGGTLVLAALWRLYVTEAALLPAFLLPFAIGGVLAAMGAGPGWLSARWVPWLALVVLVLNLPGLRGAVGAEIWGGFYPMLWLDPLRVAAITLCLASAVRSPGRWLIGWPLAALGRVSLGVYLFHRPLLRGLEGILADTPGAAIIIFALTVALAAVSFQMVEKPMNRLIRHALTRPRRPAPPPAAASPRAGGTASFQAATIPQASRN